MSNDRAVRKLVEQIRRGSVPAATRTMHQGVVVSSDPVEGTAEVLIGSTDEPEASTTVTIHKQAGFLPAVGATVMVNMNGAEPIVNAAQHMVEGGMQSRDYTPDVTGWLIDAEGNAEFNNATIRGILRTGAGDSFIRIAYDEVTDTHSIVFEEPIDSDAPAFIQRIDDADWRQLIICGANSPSAPSITLMSEIDAPYRFKTVIYGDVYVNGMNVTKPPMAWYRRNSNQSIPNNTATTLTGRTAINKNDPATENGSSRMVPGRVGTWEVTVNVSWELNGSGAYRRLQLVNDSTSEVSELDIRGPAGGFAFHNVTRPVLVTDVNHQFSMRVRHDAGASINVEYAGWHWKHISD